MSRDYIYRLSIWMGMCRCILEKADGKKQIHIKMVRRKGMSAKDNFKEGIEVLLGILSLLLKILKIDVCVIREFGKLNGGGLKEMHGKNLKNKF